MAEPKASPSRVMTDEERNARVYEDEVFPLIGQKLVDLLIRGVPATPNGQVLQIGCGLGSGTTELLHRLDADSRIIAVEASPSLVERARANVNAEQIGRRVFFRSHALDGSLPFADASFGLVLVNANLAEIPHPEHLVSELARVVRPGGQVRLATTLRGTWLEFLDVYRDVLVRLRREDALASLRGYAASFPRADAVIGHLEQHGLGELTQELDRWELIFRSTREFFYAPVIEAGPLPRWKQIAGRGAEMQDTFLAVKGAIDTYFAGRPFSVSIEAGLFVGYRSAGEES